MSLPSGTIEQRMLQKGEEEVGEALEDIVKWVLDIAPPESCIEKFEELRSQALDSVMKNFMANWKHRSADPQPLWRKRGWAPFEAPLDFRVDEELQDNAKMLLSKIEVESSEVDPSEEQSLCFAELAEAIQAWRVLWRLKLPLMGEITRQQDKVTTLALNASAYQNLYEFEERAVAPWVYECSGM